MPGAELTQIQKAQKFNQLHDDDDGDLEEESLLETPLDKVEPYGMFKEALLRKSPSAQVESKQHL